MQRHIPDHAGRPVSAWFRDLCSGVWGGTPRAERFPSAYRAFSEMEPNVVPYLIGQLKYDRSGVRQKVIGYFRHYSVTRRLTTGFIWPTDRRSYAAVALRQMGPKAEAAIPELLESWAHDAPSVKVNAISALESVLYDRFTESGSQAEWRKIESAVIAEASRRCPEAALKLGLRPP
jgi:hypothetical protein